MAPFWTGLNSAKGCIAQNTSAPPGRHTLPTPPRDSPFSVLSQG